MEQTYPLQGVTNQSIWQNLAKALLSSPNGSHGDHLPAKPALIVHCTTLLECVINSPLGLFKWATCGPSKRSRGLLMMHPKVSFHSARKVSRAG
eukprot:1148607-Pelagomonas_calceolata.AAC.11